MAKTSSRLYGELFADRSLEKEQPAPEDYYRLYRLCRMMISDDHHVLPDWKNMAPYDILESMNDVFHFQAAVGLLGTSRFCITNGGLFGMVPNHTQVCDSIFVVKRDP